MKLFLSALVLLITSQLFAQKIEKIEFDGMVHLSKPVALRMLSFEAGSQMDEQKVDKAIKKYFAQGYFKDIWVDMNDKGVLIFHFVEKPIISKVELKGWKSDDEDVKKRVIQIKKGSLYDEKKIESAKKRIIEAISQDGKIDSVVEVKKTLLDNGSIKLTFIVNSGEEIVIQKLDYSGAKNLDSDDFDDVVANKQHQFMGWLWGRNDGKMSLRDLEYDNLRIKDLYMQNGYLDAMVSQPFTRVDFDYYTADMSYQIKEGKPYKINSVSFYQVKEVIAEKKLQDVITLKKGEVFNIKTFRSDANKIKTLVADKAYAFVQVIPDLQKNKKNHTVNVVFKIIPGDKVKIRNVFIAGNTRTLDRVIRRELYLAPGDMYSATDLKDSRNSLARLGYFDTTTIEEKRIDSETMDLVVKVKEAPTGNIQLGGGYGSYGGILLNVGVNDRNIFGSGINVGLKAEKSELSHNYSFNISNPRLNDSDFSGNFSIFQSSHEYDDYTVNSAGVTVGSGYKFTRHLTSYFGYSYSTNDYDVNDDINTTLTDTYYFESYDKSSVIGSLSYNDTDDYYLPREGIILSQSIEKAGLGGDADFVKAKTSFSAFKGLDDYIDFDAILRYKARYNIILDNGYVLLAEKFYMGGIGSVRGYQGYSLSPTITDENGVERKIGGKQTFSNSAEISFPFIPKAKMRVLTFVDWGFIGEDSLDEISRGGYGFGLEWFSPVGPIQLIFAHPLNEHEGDDTSSFEFTMGRRF